MSIKAKSALLDQFRGRWATFSVRERLALQFACGVLALTLFWSLLLAPSLKIWFEAPSIRADLENQLQLLQRLAAEAKQLQQVGDKGTSKLDHLAAEQALRNALKQELGSQVRMGNSGENVMVTLEDVTPEALARCLARARSEAHALPLNVQLHRSHLAGAIRWSGSMEMKFTGY